MAEHVGLASIYRQKNPYDRKVETTAAMLPKSGYASPFLAYVMGRDTARAGEWDSERDRKLEEIFNKQAMSEEEKAKAKASLDFMELALKTPATAEGNAQVKEVWENYFKLKTGANFNIDNIRALGEDKNSKEMVIDNGGEKTVIYLTPTGINLVDKETGEVRPFDPIKDGDRFRNAPKAPETRSVLQGDEQVNQEFDAASGQFKEVGRGRRWEPAKGGEGLDDFRSLKGQLEELYGRKASIQKGFDPVTGSVIPQTQIDAAIATIDGGIKDAENYMQQSYPLEWRRYRVEKPQGAEVQSLPLDRAGKSPPAPQGGNPPAAGAKQAPDGKWYVPDSKRPGKWLLVR